MQLKNVCPSSGEEKKARSFSTKVLFPYNQCMHRHSATGCYPSVPQCGQLRQRRGSSCQYWQELAGPTPFGPWSRVLCALYSSRASSSTRVCRGIAGDITGHICHGPAGGDTGRCAVQPSFAHGKSSLSSSHRSSFSPHSSTSSPVPRSLRPLPGPGTSSLSSSPG